MRQDSTSFANYAATSIRFSLLGAAFAGVTACSHSAQIAEHAGHYNDTLAIVEDEMMLKNILRAAKRRKMHFTRLQSFTGSLNSNFSLTSNLRAGADGATEAFFNPITAGTSSSPSYSLTSLNSKAFNNGIRTPVSASTFDVFLDQGWRLPVLLNILVESITVSQKTKKGPRFLCKIENDPFSQMDRYTEFVKIASGNVSRVPYGQQEKPFGPSLRAGQIGTGKQLEALKNTGYELREDGRTKRYRLYKPTAKTALKVTTVKVTKDGLNNAIASGDPCSVENIAPLVDRTEAQVQVLDAGGPNVVELEAQARLRSAQSMIFYLGELSRFDLANSTQNPDLAKQNVGANFYWNVSEGGGAGSIISTNVRGVGSIQIPDGHPQTDSTLRMLTLVQQVFDLNTASDKAPVATPVIRLVN